jgi:hypothetical protein
MLAALDEESLFHDSDGREQLTRHRNTALAARYRPKRCPIQTHLERGGQQDGNAVEALNDLDKLLVLR